MERTDRQERADREELQRIAANVRRRRKDRDWTQEDLAEHAGIDEKQVQRIEAKWNRLIFYDGSVFHCADLVGE